MVALVDTQGVDPQPAALMGETQRAKRRVQVPSHGEPFPVEEDVLRVAMVAPDVREGFVALKGVHALFGFKVEVHVEVYRKPAFLAVGELTDADGYALDGAWSGRREALMVPVQSNVRM